MDTIVKVQMTLGEGLNGALRGQKQQIFQMDRLVKHTNHIVRIRKPIRFYISSPKLKLHLVLLS